MIATKNNPEIWEEIFRGNEWGKYPPVSVIKFVARNFYNAKDRKQIKILEIGSGPGANLWFIAREGFTVYGIDFSITACERARKRLENDNLSERIGDVLTGDYREKVLEFEDTFFDAIVDVESLYCNSFEKSRKIIEICFQKLKPGGVMFSQTFNENTWGFKETNEVEYHAAYPEEGPLASKGFARYTTREDIDQLYKSDCSFIKTVELQELHLSNGKSISEWLIEVEKI